jgi:hypothetical protein
MRRVGSGGMAAALIVGLWAAVGIAGGPDDDGKAPPKGLLAGWFGNKPKPTVKVDQKTIDEQPPLVNTAPTTISERQRQEHAVLRRMEVCDSLRRVALQTNNEALMRQADDLEMRAQEIYRQQTANLTLLAAPPPSSLLVADRKPAKRDKTATSGASNKDLEMGRMMPRGGSSLYDTPSRLGGSMEEREQAAINGTGLGRDRP